jgi:hypothetical protein
LHCSGIDEKETKELNTAKEMGDTNGKNVKKEFYL